MRRPFVRQLAPPAPFYLPLMWMHSTHPRLLLLYEQTFATSSSFLNWHSSTGKHKQHGTLRDCSGNSEPQRQTALDEATLLAYTQDIAAPDARPFFRLSLPMRLTAQALFPFLCGNWFFLLQRYSFLFTKLAFSSSSQAQASKLSQAVGRIEASGCRLESSMHFAGCIIDEIVSSTLCVSLSATHVLLDCYHHARPWLSLEHTSSSASTRHAMRVIISLVINKLDPFSAHTSLSARGQSWSATLVALLKTGQLWPIMKFVCASLEKNAEPTDWQCSMRRTHWIPTTTTTRLN